VIYGKALGILLALAGVLHGVWLLYDAGGDAREDSVRLEWAREKLELTAARDQAIREAADARKAAESIKQDNSQRGENVIEQTRNLDPDWSSTKLPAGLYDTLRQN
jgi:hypothetical protein